MDLDVDLLHEINSCNAISNNISNVLIEILAMNLHIHETVIFSKSTN